MYKIYIMNKLYVTVYTVKWMINASKIAMGSLGNKSLLIYIKKTDAL